MARRHGRGARRELARATAAELASVMGGRAAYYAELAASPDVSAALRARAALHLQELRDHAVAVAASRLATVRDSRRQQGRRALLVGAVRAAVYAARRQGRPAPTFRSGPDDYTRAAWVAAGLVLPWDVPAPVAFPCDIRDRARGVPARYVTVYYVSRQYGGPEEGGWYWDAWEPITSVSVRTRAAADRTAGRLAAMYGSDVKPRELSSVLSDGVHVVMIEPRRGDATKRHPGRWE